jgi:hypothetical protein
MGLFLDSGAFSAFTQKGEVNLEEYIEYIQKNRHLIKVYAVLDIIGDPEKTWENQEYMESIGLTPLPIFHINEDWSYLERCLTYEYFAIGGTATSFSMDRRRQFFEDCWERIIDDEGFPLSRVHGLGITSPEFVSLYPWYSVDSASWRYFGPYGNILVPRMKNGEYNYKTNPYTVSCSYRIDPNKCKDGSHLLTMSKYERDHVIKYCESLGVELGKSRFLDVDEGYELKNNESFVDKKKTKVEKIIRPGIRNNSVLRDHICFAFYQGLCNSQPEYPWSYKPKKGGFF